MKIKSAKSFRVWYKTKVKEIEESNLQYNEDFVGTYHKENGKNIKGFFEMYHGDKPDIESYLPSILKIAEDGQAIYEFLQNAVDCNSTHFYIFYDENYFIAINNGDPFNQEGIKSILNIAQSTKSSCDKIGRFGIGFKLVHRLVGANEGVNELVNDFKGPILFSWSKQEQFEGLINNQNLEPLNFNNEDRVLKNEYFESPYLFKLLLTNFPCGPNEIIKDLKYNDFIGFKNEELFELSDFLNTNLAKHIDTLKLNDLQKGSLFFLKLGKGKNELLKKNHEDLKNGIQYSMNTLKKLEKVFINDQEIFQEKIQLEEFKILKDSEDFNKISPEYKECDIKLIFGYNYDYKDGINIKNSPNFYKYFPLGDEINGFNFIIHCDSFSNEANRRKLQHDNINKELFPVIAQKIIHKLDVYKDNIEKRGRFLRFYTSILMSDSPNKQNNEWLQPIFYTVLLDYLKINIPTQLNKISTTAQNVKIKKTKLNIQPVDFGCAKIEWFNWHKEEDSILVAEASNKEKLGLQKWDIIDLIKYAVNNGEIETINNWIKKADNNFINDKTDFSYINFLKEINSCIVDGEFEIISQIKLFKFSDNNFYSINEALSNENLIIINNEIVDIKYDLKSIGFIFSILDISKNERLYKHISPLINEEKLFCRIAEKTKNNTLSIDRKHILFNVLAGFSNIGPEKLKDLVLFKDTKGNFKPLRYLVKYEVNNPNLIVDFQINKDEYQSNLDKYLVDEKNIYETIIVPNFEQIILQKSNPKDFYSTIISYYDIASKQIPLANDNFVYINERLRFVSQNEVYFNRKLIESKDYSSLQSAIYRLTNFKCPDFEILEYLTKAPFLLKDNNILDSEILARKVTLDEAKSFISFCKLNNENFFEKNVIIQKGKEDYSIQQEGTQISPSSTEINNFIRHNPTLMQTLFILPYDLDEFKKDEALVKGEKLWELIFNTTDINDFKVEIIDLLTHKEIKIKFINQLSDIKFEANIQYEKDSFEYKLLDLACEYLSEFDKFRKKVKIIYDEKTLKLSEIPPFTDSISIEGINLSLSQILPNSYQNTNILGDLVEYFSNLGLDKNKLEKLFGITNEIELSDIFEKFKETVQKTSNNKPLLQNTDQILFVLLYNKSVIEINLSNFYIYTEETNFTKHVYSLDKEYYTTSYSFIDPKSILDSNKYKELEKIQIKIFPSFYSKPIIENKKFDCYLMKNSFSDSELIDFLCFIYGEWKISENKTDFKTINWSKINNIDTILLLGFNPMYSVYPSEFALEKEQLPEYLQNWLTDDEKILFISDLGVFTENSTLVSLRKHFLNLNAFDKNVLAKDSNLIADENMLFNTFEWLKERNLVLKNSEALDIFEEMRRLINASRNPKSDLVIQNEFNFELLVEQTIEWNEPFYINWKKDLEGKFTIYLNDGLLPKTIMLDEIKDYVFYRFNENHIAIKENAIYLNKNAEFKKELNSIVDENHFTQSDYDKLFNFEKDNEISLLKEENERLKKLHSKNIEKFKVEDVIKEFSPDVQLQLKKKSFEDEVNNFIDNELEDSEWYNHIPELKSLLELGIENPKEKQKAYNLIAKLKLSQSTGIRFETSNKEYNKLEEGEIKYFVHSARGAFAYIHPDEILKMKTSGYKMALDFGKGIVIYNSAEEILSKNKSHLMVYQNQDNIDNVIQFCQNNSGANKHLLFIDPINSKETSKEIMNLLIASDEY